MKDERMRNEHGQEGGGWKENAGESRELPRMEKGGLEWRS